MLSLCFFGLIFVSDMFSFTKYVNFGLIPVIDNDFNFAMTHHVSDVIMSSLWP